MSKQKIVIISKNELSTWKSCQSIVGNLAKVYQESFNSEDISFISVAANFNAYQAYKTVEHIKKIGAEFIVWIDHSPNPTELIKALAREYTDTLFSNRPKLLVHLFGDFVIDCLAWKDVEKELSEWPLHFLTASHRQQKLVESFFQTSKKIVTCLPFPIDDSVFNTNAYLVNREQVRNNLDVANDEKVFLYTGRISYQKNVDLVLRAFSSLEEMFGGRIHLWIAGGLDDILLPYFGKHGLLGSYFSHLVSSVAENSKVRFLGNCETDELVALYHAADVFVSVSTYNDEDYGMAPAEALSCGLPALLSDWGGYSSFAKYCSHVKSLSVFYDSFRPLVSSVHLKKAMMTEAIKGNYPQEERRKVSAEILAHISISSVSKKLKTMWGELSYGVVDNFSELFVQTCAHFKKNKFAPFKNEIDEMELAQTYKDVYGVYGYRTVE